MTNVTQDQQDQVVKGTLSDDWRTTGDGYVSTDLVIDAYEAGRAQGSREEFLSTLQGSVGEGVKKASMLGETFYTQLKEVFRVDCKRVLLKMDSILDNGGKPCVHFDLLYVVTEEDYVKESFLGIYDLSAAFSEEANDETFSVSISFMTDSEGINDELLVCDGFKYAYAK